VMRPRGGYPLGSRRHGSGPPVCRRRDRHGHGADRLATGWLGTHGPWAYWARAGRGRAPHHRHDATWIFRRG